MSLTFSFIFLAAGAILRYAVEEDLWSGVNEDIVGMILMVIGLIGILLTIFVVSTMRAATWRMRDRIIPGDRKIPRR